MCWTGNYENARHVLDSAISLVNPVIKFQWNSSLEIILNELNSLNSLNSIGWFQGSRLSNFSSVIKLNLPRKTELRNPPKKISKSKFCHHTIPILASRTFFKCSSNEMSLEILARLKRLRWSSTARGWLIWFFQTKMAKFITNSILDGRSLKTFETISSLFWSLSRYQTAFDHLMPGIIVLIKK